MNENLQQAVAALLNKALTTVDSAGAFLQAQLPDYVQQLMQWNFTVSLLLCILSIVLIILWICAEIFAIKALKKTKANECAWGFGYVLLGSIPRGFMILLITCVWSIEWLQIWLTPKVWLVQYVAHIMK